MHTEYYKWNGRADASGFTLMELLIVIGIVGILASLVTVTAEELRKQGNLAREVAAARTLLGGIAGYSADYAGEIMPGVDRTVTAVDARGNPIHGEPAYRYPWRLAPYIQFEVNGAFITDLNKGMSAEDTYMVSVSPILGMNAHLVGGYVHSKGLTSDDKIRYCPEECVTRMSQQDSGRLIVFASAHSKRYASDPGSKGNFIIAAPGLNAPGFTPWISKAYKENDLSVNLGHVDLRHPGNRAVAARLDGTVETLDELQLKDMRNWSLGAIAADDPNYRVMAR